MKKVRAGSFSFDDKAWNNISDNCKDFISKLLTYKPDERPTASDSLKHPWIVELATVEIDDSAAVSALDNLKTFKADSTMKQATFAFIASQLLSK
jgi:serine/threonine protein kinase